MNRLQHLPHFVIPAQTGPRMYFGRSVGFAILMLGSVLCAVPTLAQMPSPQGETVNSGTTNSGTANSGTANPEVTPNPESAIDPEATTSPETSPAVAESYTLGTGDRVNIAIFGAPEYSGEALVSSDGSLNLPTAGSVPVRGMTLQEASEAIATHYAPFIHRPYVTVTLVALRPVRVGIAGEVNRPGSYTLSEESSEFPTLTDAIKTAGGITSSANLQQIQVRRQQPNSEQIIDINLLEMLQTGDQSKDIILHGGDTVFIPTATALAPEEALQLGTASFAPDTVTVYVVGEVKSPGTINVPQNTPLNQAILAAGGFDQQRADTDSVQLVRLNPNGTVSQRDIPINFEQGINEASNPTLHQNDVIVVGRSNLANFAEATELALGPFGRIISSFLSVLRLF